jgi:hypothetical protein
LIIGDDIDNAATEPAGEKGNNIIEAGSKSAQRRSPTDKLLKAYRRSQMASVGNVVLNTSVSDPVPLQIWNESRWLALASSIAVSKDKF